MNVLQGLFLQFKVSKVASLTTAEVVDVVQK